MGLTHQEELYISPKAKDNIISFETLKRLGYTHTNKEIKNPQPTNTIKQKTTQNMTTSGLMWKERKNQPDNKTKFILDTGSQINIISRTDAAKHNVDIEKLKDEQEQAEKLT